MSQRAGPSEDALAATGLVLITRNRDLGEADRELSGIIADAHAIALTAIARLDELKAQIENAVKDQALDSAVEAREFSRFLILKQREIADVLARARSDVDAKTAALQRLIARYQPR